MDREAWRATGHGITKSRARLKQLSTHVTFTCSPFKHLGVQTPSELNLSLSSRHLLMSRRKEAVKITM